HATLRFWRAVSVLVPRARRACGPRWLVEGRPPLVHLREGSPVRRGGTPGGIALEPAQLAEVDQLRRSPRHDPPRSEARGDSRRGHRGAGEYLELRTGLRDLRRERLLCGDAGSADLGRGRTPPRRKTWTSTI